MSKFFSLNYYFDPNPLMDVRTLRLMLAFFVIMVVIGIGIKIYEKAKKLSHIENKLADKYFSLLVVMGFVGILLTWFRYENAYFVSARFWTLIWLAFFIIWLVSILRYQYKVVPLAKKQAEQKKIFAKYLPKKNK